VSGEQSLLDYVLEVARQLYGKDVPDRLVTELAACANASGACPRIDSGDPVWQSTFVAPSHVCSRPDAFSVLSLCLPRNHPWHGSILIALWLNDVLD